MNGTYKGNPRAGCARADQSRVPLDVLVFYVCVRGVWEPVLGIKKVVMGPEQTGTEVSPHFLNSRQLLSQLVPTYSNLFLFPTSPTISEKDSLREKVGSTMYFQTPSAFRSHHLIFDLGSWGVQAKF